MDELLQQIKRNYGDDVLAMPDDLAAYYLARVGGAK
jgi:hypothetical protein